MEDLVKKEEWETFMDTLALTIYGLVLFPSSQDVISLAAIGVFINYKCQGENPVPAVLADILYTLNICREKSSKRILCCLPVLYVWMTSLVFERDYKAICPITDFQMLGLEPHDGKNWAIVLVNLKADKVRWCPDWKEVKNVLYQCGEFPNIPLVGTTGCINYNPSLALRQFLYPMIGEPPKESYTPFIAELTDSDMLKKIRKAWENVVYKNRELGHSSCGVDESYMKWVKDRVNQIKLPFPISRNQGEATTGDVDNKRKRDSEEDNTLGGNSC
ncbi:unnamed protein product [Lathyrus sativus]|nr:unnamed protein product [Lathyrus sativus]